MKCLSLVLLAFSIASLPTFAGENWPQFRGPGAQGHSAAKNVPLEWDTEKNVAWKIDVPGKGWSSPAYVDGRIYLTTAVPEPADPKQHTLRALCYDAKDGKLIWDKRLFRREAIRIHKKNSHASVSPRVDGERIFVHFGAQGSALLDLDGNIIWRKTDIDYKMVHGNGGVPALADGKYIFACDGAKEPFIMALDAETGKVAWKTPRKIEVKKTFTFSSPLVVDDLVLSPASGGLVAYQTKNGKEVWRAGYDQGYSVIPRPVVGEFDGKQLAFCGSGYDRATAVCVELGGKGDVTESHVKWRIKKAAPHTPSMILKDDMLFMIADIGLASCVNPVSGEVYWTERIGGQHSSSPVLAEDRIYFQDERGKGTVIKAAKTFEVLATNDLREQTLASYAVTDGALFIRTLEHLYRIGK